MQKMDQCVALENVANNEKHDAEVLQETSGELIGSARKLDNDGHQNNNVNVVHNSSFIPTRFTRRDILQHSSFQKTRFSDQNRTTQGNQQRMQIGNACYPHALSRTQSPVDKLSAKNRSIRRHSVGVDDFTSGAPNLVCRTNSNQEKRFQTIGHHANFPFTSPAVRTRLGVSGLSEINKDASNIESNGYKMLENQNYRRAAVNFSNGNQKLFSDKDVESISTFEKLKDKSFKRKSSLNRLEFVQPETQSADSILNQVLKLHSNELQSTSEDEDGVHSFHGALVDVSALSSVKRKTHMLHASTKNNSERETKEDFLQRNTSKERNKTGMPYFWNMHQNSLKMKNTKSSIAVAPHLQKRSYSAGEHESPTDHGLATGKSKICLSAQETDGHEHGPIRLIRKLRFSNQKNSSSGLSSAHKLSNKNVETLYVKTATENDCKQIAVNICDNSSQINLEEALPVSNSQINFISEVTLANSTESKMSEVEVLVDQIKNCHNDLTVYGVGHDESSVLKDADSQLAADQSSLVTQTDNLKLSNKICDLTTVKDNDQNILSLPSTNSSNHNIAESINEMANLALVSLECGSEVMIPEAVSVVEESEAYLESEKDASKQPNSILRKKSLDDKKEIHGILKYTGDEKFSKQPLSILKHRESSEEKDPQPDLHSILKKSTSEDESYHSNPDIRPILKNTSTDDESSGATSKPKPILKKRTSFSEECSYACFHINELKPILKKKSISEEQPKPILKTRRKSEEAKATMAEFPISTRPRAYSADRGMKPNVEKRLEDDDDVLSKDKDTACRKHDSHEL